MATGDRRGMDISLFALLAVAYAAVAVGTCSTRTGLHRRFRRAPLVQATALGAAAWLVPANVVAALVLPGGDPAGPLALALAAVSLVGLVAILTLAARLRIATGSAAAPRRILAIGAHPDDIELSCAGTLAKLVDSGHEVHVLVLCRGAEGGHARTRTVEAERGGGLLGVTSVTVLDFPDTRLDEHRRDLLAAIEARLHRVNPDIVFTHSAHDRHQDHQAVHEATLRAARQHQAVLCYESPSATTSFTPSVFVDIEDYVGVKVAAVAAHRDQRGKPYMSGERVRGLAVFRGSQAKTRYAEGFEPVRLLGSSLGQL